MWPYLLPAAVGALGGGLTAAQQGKNPLEIGTAALIGGGLGVGAGVGGRMAGQMFASSGLGKMLAPGAYQIAQKLGTAEPVSAAITNPLLRAAATQGAQRAALASGVGGAFGTGASFLIPGTAAALAGAPGAILGGARQAGGNVVGGARALGIGQADSSGNINMGDTVPNVGPTGEYGNYGKPSDVIDLFGRSAGSRLEQELEQDVQLKGIKKMAPYLQAISEASKKAEFERGMAAAGIRQNIATDAAMRQRSQQTAQQMGLNFAGQVGQAITSQYQYS